MAGERFGGRLMVIGAALVVSAPLAFSTAAVARTRSGHAAGHVHAMRAGMHAAHRSSDFGRRFAHFAHTHGGGLQCVPFARENTGIEISGNANTWWDAAAGVYERGSKPEVGSILNFRSTGHMRLGHVAVVSNVIDSRTIEIDHANWGRGRINRDMKVVDLSPGNDWSAVRVGSGTGTYPTYGFIYDRPDTGTMVANTDVTPSKVAANAVPDEAVEPEEVAEAADDVGSTSSYRHSHAARHGRHAARASIVRTSYHGIVRGHSSHRHRS